ncbi:MAG: dgkA [Firmicutes bacterium]|nr:dgkA [Bacillota bacterium]
MTRRNWAKTFFCAWTGVTYGFVTQRNMKVHAAVAVIVLVAAWKLEVSPVEWVILILTIAGVIATELLNTAVEAAVDLFSPEFHPLAKIAKDTSAGAVLVMAMASVVVGCLIFIRRLIG